MSPEHLKKGKKDLLGEKQQTMKYIMQVSGWS
jgi:hypothetical protein